jgi:succinoglycan biosynthesis transport protein ExoP
MGLALLVGLVGGIAAAFGLEALDMTVRTPDQAEAVSALPTIGVIPVQPGLDAIGRRSGSRLLKGAPLGNARPCSLIAYLEPKSEIAEAYRALRTSVLLSSAGQQPHTILITSALPQDGKTMTSVNTAIVLAQQGKRVLLIDADLRRPNIHKVFGIRPEFGLTNVLTGGATVEEALQPTVQPNLFLMPSGPLPPHPSELLGSVRMQQLIRQWRTEYDHVIIDSPPALSVTDAVLISVQVDIVILVIRSGQTTTHALRRTRDLLMNVKANVMGIVLNAVDLTSPDYYYYYYSGNKYGKYGYYSDKNAPQLKTEEGEGPGAAGTDKLAEETKAGRS